MSTIKVDTITDEAGSGAPDFPNGMTGNGSSLTGLATAAQGALADTSLQPALAGVTSVDATTAAAITAAGVGGGSKTLLQDVSITADVTSFDIDFTGNYDEYLISLDRIVATNVGDLLVARFLDGSNNLAADNEYNQSYIYGSTSNVIDRLYGGEMSTDRTTDILMHVYFPKDSSKHTKVISYQIHNIAGSSRKYYHLMTVQEVHNTLRFYSNDGYSIDGTSGGYKLWGIE